MSKKPKPQDPQIDRLFDPEFSDTVSDDHAKFATSRSPLFGIHNLLGAEARNYIDTYDHRVHGDYVEDIYEAKMGLYTMRVVMQTFSLTSLSKKRITYPSTQLGFQKLLAILTQDWRELNGDLTQLKAVQDILMKTFVVNSGNCQYMVEFDAGYWSVAFLDCRTNTSVDITISRG